MPGETFRETQALGFFGVVGLGDERLQTANMAIPQPDIGPLPGFEAFSVPIAGEHAFAGEERADFRMVETFALKIVLQHDMEQRTQRRAGKLDAPIAKVELGDPLLRGDDVVQAIHENLEILHLRTEHFLRKKGGGMVKHLAEKRQDKSLGDTVAEAGSTGWCDRCTQCRRIVPGTLPK